MEDMEDDIDLSSTKIDKDEVHDNEVLRFVKAKGHRAIYTAMKVNVIGTLYYVKSTLLILVYIPYNMVHIIGIRKTIARRFRCKSFSSATTR